MPERATKRSDGRYFKRWVQKNREGVPKRLFVVCPKDYNTTGHLQTLVRAAIDRYMDGKFTTSDTFSSYVLERFMPEYPAAKNLKPSSIESLQYLFEKVAIPTKVGEQTVGALPLAAINQAFIARFIATLKGKTKALKKRKETVRAYSDQTIRLTVIAIVSVLRWAHSVGDIAGMPKIEVPTVETKNKPNPYTPEEQGKLIEAARDAEERAVFLMMYDAGMRKSEILGFQWDQIDFDHDVVRIDRQRHRGIEQSTKSGRVRRFKMSPEIRAALWGVRHLRGKYVFCDRAGEPHPEHWLRWVFSRARRKAGLRHTRIHDSRHAFSRRATDHGIATFDLRELLGHADVRTTQDYVAPAPTLPPSILGASQ